MSNAYHTLDTALLKPSVDITANHLSVVLNSIATGHSEPLYIHPCPISFIDGKAKSSWKGSLPDLSNRDCLGDFLQANHGGCKN
ncbi:hypothetical protein EMCG_08964 [[Emmonsia] crescens]|uniref:Uncharacterized protein n=1 Tax=[Emmonsia] crescens TaxID=73230 RepID=A0A0G2J3P3_9EURO|nr:hypothetical protein EMCG_08964 [Emmonsia crescens UAMH 3008]